MRGEVGVDGEVKASVGDETVTGFCHSSSSLLCEPLVTHPGATSDCRVVRHKNTLNVFHNGENHEISLAMPKFLSATGGGRKGGLTSPMPGKIVKLFVKPGEEVKKGQPLIVMEAMKMEVRPTLPSPLGPMLICCTPLLCVQHTIRSPADGKVKNIAVAVDQFVEQNVALAQVE